MESEQRPTFDLVLPAPQPTLALPLSAHSLSVCATAFFTPFDKEPLLLHVAQNAFARYLFAKAPEQALLRFTGLEYNLCQI